MANNQSELILVPRISSVETDLRDIKNDLKQLSGKLKLDVSLNVDKSSLENLNLPKLKLDIDVDTKQVHNLLKNVEPLTLKNPVADKLADFFGIKKLADIKNITAAVNEYQNVLKSANSTNISKSYENISDSVISGLRNVKKETTDAIQLYQNLISYMNKTKAYVPLEDRGDNYAQNRLDIGAKTIVNVENAKQSINELYEELRSLYLNFFPENIINPTDQFEKIAQVMKNARQAVKDNKLSESDVKEMFSEDMIRDAIDNIVNSVDSGTQKLEKSIAKIGNLGKPVNLFQYGLTENDIIGSTIEQIETLFNTINKFSGKANATLINTEVLKEAGNDIAKFNYELTNNDGNIEKWNRSINLSTGQVFEQQTQIQQSTGAVRENSTELNNASKNTSEFSENINKSGEEIKSTEKHTNNFAESLKRMVAQYIGVRALFNAFREGVQSVIEISNAMNNLQMITGWNSQQAKENILLYNQMAIQLGVSTKSIMENADGWLRQGKSIEETNELIKVSATFARVAQLSGAEATELLTAALNGYNLEAKDAIKITDSLNGVDLVAATSAKELATSMKYSASFANSVGISYEKLIALIATASETTRLSAEQIGTAYKSIISRMSNIKVGKFVDDDTGEALNDVEKVLDKLGIKLRESETEWRDFGSVFDEIGKKWESFNDIEKSAISTAISGARQSNIFSATMENYGKVLEYTSVAQDSAGTTLEKFGVITDSIDYKVNAFKESLVGMWQGTIDSEIIKNVVDLGTGVLNLTEKFGGLNNVILLAASWYTLLHFKDIVSGFKNVAESVAAAGGGIKGIIAFIQNYSAASQYAKANNTSLAASYQVLGVSINMIQLAITGAMIALSAEILIYNSWQQAQEKSRQETLEFSNEMRNQITTIDELKAKIQAESLSRENLIDLITSHNSKYGEEISKLDDLNQMRQKSIDLLDIEAKKKAEEVIRESGSEYIEQKKFLTSSYKSNVLGLGRETFESPQAALEDYQAVLDEYNQKIADGIPLSNSQKEILKTVEKAYDDLSKKIEYAIPLVENYEQSQNLINGTYQSTAENVNTATDSIDGFVDKSSKIITLSQIVANLSNDMSLLDTISQNLNTDFAKWKTEDIEEFSKEISKLQETYPALYDAIMRYNSAKTEENANLVQSAIDYYTAEEAAKELNQTYSDNISALNDLNSIYADAVTSKTLDAKSIQSLIEKYPELASSVKKTAEGYTVEADAVSTLIEKHKELTEESIRLKKESAANTFRSTAGINVEDTIKNISAKIESGEITSWEQYAATLNGSVIPGLKEFTEAQLAAKLEGELLNDEINIQSDLINKLNADLDNIQSAYKTVYDAIDQWNEKKFIDIDTYQALLQIAPQYIDLLTDENGNLTLTKEALNNVTRARIEELAQKQASSLLDMASQSNNEADALSKLKIKIDEVTGSLIELNAQRLIEIKTNFGDEVYNETVAQLQMMENVKNKALAGVGKQESFGVSVDKPKKEKDAWLEAFNEAYDEIKHLRAMNIDNDEQYYQKLSDLDAKYFAGNKKYIKEHQKNIEELHNLQKTIIKSSIDDIQSAYQTVSKAIDEISEYGSVSVDSYQAVLEIAPRYLDLLIDEKGNLILTKDALNAVTKARIDEAAQKQAEILINTVLQYQSEADALDYLRIKIDAVTESLAALNAEALVEIQVKFGDDVYNEVVEKLQAIDKLRQSAKKEIDTYSLVGGEETARREEEAKKAAEKAAEEAKKAAEEAEKAYKEAAEREFKDLEYQLKKREITEEEYYNRLEILNNKYYKDKSNYLDDYRSHELEIIDGREKLYKESFDKEKKELELRQKEVLISEEDYYKKLRELNATYFKDKEQYSDEYRQNEIDAIEALRGIEEQKLDLALSEAEDRKDYNGQIEILKEYQDLAFKTRQDYIDAGLDLTDVEVLEQKKKYREFGERILNVYNSIYEDQRKLRNNALKLLENQSIIPENLMDDESLVENFQRQIDINEAAMRDAHVEAERLRSLTDEDGKRLYDEFSDEIQAQTQIWWEAYKANLELQSKIVNLGLEKYNKAFEDTGDIEFLYEKKKKIEDSDLLSTKERAELIKQVNSEIYNELKSEHEKYISTRNNLEIWGTDSEIATRKRWLEKLKELYQDGLISHKDFIDETLAETERLYALEQKEVEKIYKGMQKAAVDAIDAEIEALENLSKAHDDEIERLKERLDLLNEQKNLYDQAYKAVEKTIDGEVEKLNEQKKLYKRLIKNKSEKSS